MSVCGGVGEEGEHFEATVGNVLGERPKGQTSGRSTLPSLGVPARLRTIAYFLEQRSASV